MAKKQPSHKAVDKKPKSVSTSAIFKKTKVYPVPRTQPTVRKLFKDSKFLKESQNRHKPEHPLAIAFSESISNSREHIEKQATASLTSICQELSDRVISVNTHFEEQLEAASVSSNKLIKPLQEEKLLFKSHDGRSSGTVVLGDRMNRFRRLVASEEKALESLYREWMDVQKEIMAMVEEVIGSTGLEELMNSGVKEGLMTMEQAKRAEELDGMKKRFSEEIERLSEEAIKGVREAEKEMKIHENKQKQRLIDLFAEED